MSRVRICRGVAVLTALVVGVCASAESARAALAGHPSYSANLSANASIRKQQLICDPFGSIYAGSMSTLYQPGLVSLSGASPTDKMIHAVTGFDITASYVEVRPFTGGNIEPVQINQTGWLINTSDFFAQPSGTFVETGYLQTFFKRSPGSVDQTVKNPDNGYTFLADDGFRDPDTKQVQGDDTHYMYFDLKPGVAPDAPIYTNFADGGVRGHYPTAGPQQDSITALLASGGPGQTITAGIDSATVPEPATGMAIAAASGLLLLQRRPQRNIALNSRGT